MPTLYAAEVERAPDPPHLVGRSADLARIRALLHEAALGNGSAVVLSGARGIGKSRFLRECGKLKSSASALTLQCGTGNVPGQDVLSQLAEGLHCSLSPARVPPQPVLFASLTEACRRRPMAILADDVHLAEPEELRALDTLISLARRLRLVVVASASQSGTAAAPRAHLQRWLDAGALEYRLAPLSDAEMELLVRSLVAAASRPLASDELREVLETAQGNPRFGAELVAAALRPGQRFPLVPPSASAIVASVREYLSKDDFDVLALCSVVGHAFHDSWILDVAQRPRAEVADALQAASDLGIIAESPPSPGWFTFREAAVRKALYASIVSLKRVLLHERVVEHLTSRGVDASETERGVLVAQHWHVLQNHANAAEWLARAADGLAERGEFAPAADLYARAAGHLPAGSEQRFAVQQRLRRCYRNLAEWARMIPVVQAMLSSVDRSSDPECADSLLWDLFYAQLNDGNQDAAAALAPEISALHLPAQPNRADIATLIIAYALCYSGRRAEAQALVNRIDFETLVSGEARLRHLIAVASIDALHEPLEHSLGLVDRAAAIASSIAIRGTAFCYGDGVEISMRFGDLQKAHVYLERMAQTAARSAGEVNDVKRAVTKDRIHWSVLCGDLLAARELVCSSLGWREGGRHNQSFLAGAAVLVGMRIGDFALVDAFFDPQLLFGSVSARDAESSGRLLLGFAEVMQARGMTKDLRAVLAQCVELRLVDPYAWIPLCAVRFGTAECAERAAELLDDYLRGAIAPSADAHRALVQAALLRRRGKHIAACDSARAAAERYRRMGWPLLAAMALEIAGDSAAASSAYAACGATFDAARLAGGQKRKLRRAPFGARLTARELEVARLVASRRSNTEIARALEISVRTVHHHIEAAFNKLGVRARWQLTEELLVGVQGGRR